MRFYEKSEKLTQNLQLLYDALAQISPTSVPSEREFSKSASFITNKRTKLSDKSFDDICFLKDCFKQEEKKDNMEHWFL